MVTLLGFQRRRAKCSIITSNLKYSYRISSENGGILVNYVV